MRYFRKWYGTEKEEEITKGEALRLIAFVHEHGERLLGESGKDRPVAGMDCWVWREE
jgi:hypothetical protein